MGGDAEDHGGEAEHEDAPEQHRPGVALDRTARQRHGHCERAAGRCRPQQSEPPGARVEDVASVDRQQRGGAAEQHREEVQRQQAQEQPLAKDEGHPREERGRSHLLGLVRGLHRVDEPDERRGQEVQRGDRRVDGGRPEAIEHAAERGADDAGRLACGRYARDGARDQRERDEARHQRGAGGILERTRGAEDRDHPEDAVAAQPAAETAERQRGGGARLGRVTHHDDEAAITAVRHLSDDERQRDGRDELHEADEAEVERAAGEAVELPSHRDVLHVQRERGQHPRAPEEREGRVTERRRGGR